MDDRVNGATGYAHPDYARVYADIGEPVFLPASRGSLLRRRIPGTGLHDLMGCYPLFCCENCLALGDDIAGLRHENISLVLIADPFFEGGPEQLQETFDFVRPFKTHYVADLSQPLDSFVSHSRRRAAHKALRKMDIEVTRAPLDLVDDWMALQRTSRHGAQASGINVLSKAEVERLFGIPGIVILRAVHAGQTLGMHVEIQQGDVVYGHFATYAPEAYRLGVSTALHLSELEHFAGRARWIDWGGVPGVDDTQNGLSRFKQEFANTTRIAYLCGSVLDQDGYGMLCERQGARTTYFPAYRNSESGKARYNPPLA